MKKIKIILGILCGISVIGGGIYYQRTSQQIDQESPVLSADTDQITVSIDATDQELLQGVSATDDKDGDVSDSILIENIEKKEDGAANEFLITYAAFDKSNNSASLTRTLYYSDYVEPHFVLKQPLRFPENQQLSLLSYFEAQDCLDGDVSPFITLEGSTDILKDTPQKGFYDVKVSVTNSVGDTAELPVQVEIYEDSYEEQTMRPQVVLNQYIAYLKQGQEFDTAAYLDYIQDKGIKPIDFGNTSKKDSEQQETLSYVSLNDIQIDSNVDVNTPGVYSVVYTYTSQETGYDCKTNLIVVVE